MTIAFRLSRMATAIERGVTEQKPKLIPDPMQMIVLMRDAAERIAELEKKDAETGRRGDGEAQALIAQCPLLFTQTCNAAELSWIERARKLTNPNE